MSLELSFVAKGASANVPVTFRAQDELSGDSLLINTSEEPFAVSPSDSSTHMTVATVTSSGKFGVVHSIYIWSKIFCPKMKPKIPEIYIQCQSFAIVLSTRLTRDWKECKQYLVFSCCRKWYKNCLRRSRRWLALDVNSRHLRFTFFIGRKTEVLTPDILRALKWWTVCIYLDCYVSLQATSL